MRIVVGIVGHEAAKFTPETEALARAAIDKILKDHDARIVISGACHLGGIDIWAIEQAQSWGIPVFECAPTRLTWSGPGGFMDRNQQIAKRSDVVYSLVVKTLPESYTGMRFEKLVDNVFRPYCYHCHTRTHVKSGGCWTAKYARAIGKPSHIVEI